MGWTIETIRPELDTLFKVMKMKYTIDHPDAMSPRVHITYDGDLPIKTMEYIVKLFPDFVYVNFMRITSTMIKEV